MKTSIKNLETKAIKNIVSVKGGDGGPISVQGGTDDVFTGVYKPKS